MTLKTIFKKPVDRPIEGVIKADDQASLRLEIEEYVLTNEVEKRLETFLDAYNDYSGANGVWVSGFFGCGKSHLLKILALLLEDRKIDGAKALDLFISKCGDNAILRGDLKRAVSLPSKSILFNIDQKADVISKTQIDALLAVFVKVFDEMCGYYGKQGHIAQFERELDSRDLYDKFKIAYEQVAGKSWEKGREQALLEAQNIAKAYAQTTGASETAAVGILDKYRSEYRVSIEDFADQILDYIDRQAAIPGNEGFRLNFFVDEVGQYIAEHVKLMTNLQTIAESLATKCRGRAWIIATAQEDMGTVVGEMGKQQGNDFSKIQARFANRMKLSSADVAEVIQKRLLTKNDEGVQMLSDVYYEQSNNFKTLFDFADGSQSYRNYQDRDHFIHCYPFIPYQFGLFQSAIQNLSLHNAFEGKHSSVGERSMLGVFQQVAIQISENQIGQLATFDLMFEGIRTALKSQIQKAVIQAENNLDDEFAIRLLKTLFLVKYVKEFKPTVRNICVLMLEAFDEDLPSLKHRIEVALNLLEQQTYIQRNGELYEYLTDEEKDVEQEIKNTEVDASDVAGELEKIIFDSCLKHRKIRYEESGQDFPFSKKLDDRLHGREYQLAIHVISPFNEKAEDETTLRMQSMGRNELLVLMSPDERLVRDLLMYKRTEKYIRQNISLTQQDSVKRILTDKSFQNRERYAAVNERVQELLERAKLIIESSELEIGSADGQTRIIRGFHELVSRTYPNLRMLRGISYSEGDIAKCLKHSEHGLFGSGSTSLSEAEQETLAFIQSNSRGGVRTTLKSLLQQFEGNSYGWYYAAVLCTLAHLCARGKVEIRIDGNLIEDDELERALRNTHGHSNVILEPQVEFTASQVRALKQFFEDFFDSPPRTGEAKALGKETGKAFEDLLNQLKPLASQASEYPFVIALKPVIEKLDDLEGKPYTWHVTELLREEDVLLDMKESTIDPIRKFMSGAKKEIFDDAKNFVAANEPNFAYIDSAEVKEVVTCLADPKCFSGNRIQELKLQLKALRKQTSAKIEAEVAIAKERLADLEARLSGMPEFSALTTDKQQEVTRPFEVIANSTTQQPLVAVLRDTLRHFEENEYPRQLARMTDWAKSTPTRRPNPQGDQDDPSEGTSPNLSGGEGKHTEYVLLRSLPVTIGKAWLADESDVDRYLEKMREALLQNIREGKRIQI